MKKIKYNGKVKEYSCDFCERKALFTDKTTTGTDTMFFCLVHKTYKSKKEIIVRSGLVNTNTPFIELNLFKGRGNIIHLSGKVFINSRQSKLYILFSCISLFIIFVFFLIPRPYQPKLYHHLVGVHIL